MADVFAYITEAPRETLEIIANVLETRAAIPQQQAMLQSYLAEIPFPPNARVLEVGCGTGPVCRTLTSHPNVGEVIGIDPSPYLLERAKELNADGPAIRFQEGEGTSLSFDDNSFDVVILHTLLTHVLQPEQVLGEAKRVLRPGGWLGICDGDLSTATLATGALDPWDVCTKAFVEGFVHDPWMVRRMSHLVSEAGFEAKPQRSYGLVETLNPGLTMSWVVRGADLLVSRGSIGVDLGEALKAEGRRRAEEQQFFGYMAYASVVARNAM